MSNTVNGRAAYTGALNRHGTSAVRRHYTPNRITKARRQFVLTSIDEITIAAIDAVADKLRITRGEAIASFVRYHRNRNAATQSKGVAA